VNATDTDPFPRVAVPMTGAAGTVTVSTTAFDAADGGPVPLMFVAVTVHVYVLVVVNEPTTIGLDAPPALPDAPPFEEVQLAV
jgi:hypothetical protein